jgi:hypothetical protein
MSDDEARKDIEEPADEVEAHKRHILANDDATDEQRKASDDDDDVEAHRRHIV